MELSTTLSSLPDRFGIIMAQHNVFTTREELSQAIVEDVVMARDHILSSHDAFNDMLSTLSRELKFIHDAYDSFIRSSSQKNGDTISCDAECQTSTIKTNDIAWQASNGVNLSKCYEENWKLLYNIQEQIRQE